MILNTERLILRPWEDSDAERLYGSCEPVDKRNVVGDKACWIMNRKGSVDLRVAVNRVSVEY